MVKFCLSKQCPCGLCSSLEFPSKDMGFCYVEFVHKYETQQMMRFLLLPHWFHIHLLMKSSDRIFFFYLEKEMCAGVCAQAPFSHRHSGWPLCAVKVTDIGPRVLEAMSSLTIHALRCCVPVSAVGVNLPPKCKLRGNVRYAQLTARTSWHILVSVATINSDGIFQFRVNTCAF